MQLIDYRNFSVIKNKILQFRLEKESNTGNYKLFVQNIWNREIKNIYYEDIISGKIKTRESNDTSIKKFLKTKRDNLRDYTDACLRYLRFTGLVSVTYRGKVSIFENKLNEVDFFLKNIDRDPVFLDDLRKYKDYLFNDLLPVLYTDNKNNLINIILRMSGLTRKEIEGKSTNELKDLRDEIIVLNREAIIDDQINELKSYALYSEVIDTYNEILSDNIFDAPLMMEWNTWRAMTMLDGGIIKGNFKLDDFGEPMSTAQGNMPDIECNYGDFVLSVEVTLQSGQRQYESEGEPVSRHYGQLRKRENKDTYCLFIAPTINPAALAYFFMQNKTDIIYYGGKTKIIPIELDQFMKLVENSYNYEQRPTPKHIYSFLKSIIKEIDSVNNENDWYEKIEENISKWLVE
jgi:hypothetical protein